MNINDISHKKLCDGKPFYERQTKKLSRMPTFNSKKPNSSSTLTFETAYVFKAILDELEKERS